MRSRLTTSTFRTWSRTLPSLAAAAILAFASRAGAQQLGLPMPMDTLPTIPPPVQGPPATPTLPPLPNPGQSQLTPSSLQSRQAATETPKLASQKAAIQMEPIIPSGGAPQPTMVELRKSLREDGLKNAGLPDFMRNTGAKPPTAPAGMLPATPPQEGNAWTRLFSRPTDASTTTPTPPTTPATVQTATGSEPQVVQQTSGTVPPPEQQSWWYRWTHRTTQTDNAAPQPSGPMVLPEATPLRMQ
jgi:hypothetical protein